MDHQSDCESGESLIDEESLIQDQPGCSYSEKERLPPLKLKKRSLENASPSWDHASGNTGYDFDEARQSKSEKKRSLRRNRNKRRKYDRVRSALRFHSVKVRQRILAVRQALAKHEITRSLNNEPKSTGQLEHRCQGCGAQFHSAEVARQHRSVIHASFLAVRQNQGAAETYPRLVTKFFENFNKNLPLNVLGDLKDAVATSESHKRKNKTAKMPRFIHPKGISRSVVVSKTWSPTDPSLFTIDHNHLIKTRESAQATSQPQPQKPSQPVVLNSFSLQVNNAQRRYIQKLASQLQARATARSRLANNSQNSPVRPLVRYFNAQVALRASGTSTTIVTTTIPQAPPAPVTINSIPLFSGQIRPVASWPLSLGTHSSSPSYVVFPPSPATTLISSATISATTATTTSPIFAITTNSVPKTTVAAILPKIASAIHSYANPKQPFSLSKQQLPLPKWPKMTPQLAKTFVQKNATGAYTVRPTITQAGRIITAAPAPVLPHVVRIVAPDKFQIGSSTSNNGLTVTAVLNRLPSAAASQTAGINIQVTQPSGVILTNNNQIQTPVTIGGGGGSSSSPSPATLIAVPNSGLLPIRLSSQSSQPNTIFTIVSRPVRDK